MVKINYRRFSIINILIIFLLSAGLAFFTNNYQASVVAQSYLNGVLLHDYGDYYEVAPSQRAASFNLPLKHNNKVINYRQFLNKNSDYTYVTYASGFKDVDLNYNLGFFKNEAGVTLRHIPVRDGYQFYGWWTSLNRSEGWEVISGAQTIALPGSVTAGTTLYPMFFDDSYFFLTRDSFPNNLSPNQNYALISDINLLGMSFKGFSVNNNYSAAATYNGIFDGNYLTISNLAIDVQQQNAALFISLGEKAVVRNLAVAGTLKVSNNSATFHTFGAGIAAYNNGTIYNVVNRVNVSANNSLGVSFAGGITASIGYAGSNKGTIYNVVNEGLIEAKGLDAFAAGILATNGEFYQDLFVTQTINRGDIYTGGNSANNTTAGGIVSHGVVGTKYSLNVGSIYSTNSYRSNLGGISGYIRNTQMHNKPPILCVYIKSAFSQADYVTGAYPGDIFLGGNENNVLATSVVSEHLNTLNTKQQVFVFNNNKISLTFESKL